MSTEVQRLGVQTCVAVVLATGLAIGVSTVVIGQQGFTHGQTVAPVFEGWEPNPDGSFSMVFGFYNRNCVENVHVPIGPDNHIEPGGPDREQPTRFYARRGWFIFRMRVPADFGDNEIVWTLTTQGSTEKAYGTLKPEYVLDKRITMMNEGGFGQRSGEGASLHPVLRIEGDAERTVAVGEPLTLTAFASDDGLPKPRKGQEDSPAAGLMVGWSIYRGAKEHVSFDPEQFHPDLRDRSTRNTACRTVVETPDWAKERLGTDGTFTVKATFEEPGTYMLRAMAHDGGLKTTREITVNVTG